MRRGCRHGPCDRELGSLGANALVVAAARGAMVHVIDDVELRSGGGWRGVYRLLEVGQGSGERARASNHGRPLLGDGEGLIAWLAWVRNASRSRRRPSGNWQKRRTSRFLGIRWSNAK